MAEDAGGRVRQLAGILIVIAVLALAAGVWAYVWVPPLSWRSIPRRGRV